MRRLLTVLSGIAFSIVLAGGNDLRGQGRGQAPVPAPRPAGGAAAQSSQTAPTPQPAGTGVILGQVVDADGHAIAGAIASLSGGPQLSVSVGNGVAVRTTPLPPASPRRVLTDQQGRFMFYTLSPGSYGVSASAPGYLNALYGQTRPNGASRQVVLREDDKTGNIAITLWRYAALTGVVLDEAGEPAINVNVRVLRRQNAGLRTRFSLGSSVRTDDRGIYRIGNLTPGDYLVAVPTSSTTIPTAAVEAYQKLQSARDNGVAMRAVQAQLSSSGAPFPNGGGTRIGDAYYQNNTLPGPGPIGPATGDADKVWTYQTVFFPGATASPQASVVTLGAGDERAGIDFQLRPVPSFKVSGTVLAAEGQASNLGVKLLPGNVDDFMSDNGLEVATTVTDPEGKFMFLGVPEGSYVVKILRTPRNVAVSAASFQGGTVQFASNVGQASQLSEPTLWAEATVSVSDSDVAGLSLALRPGPRVTGRVEFDGTATKPAMDRTPPQINVNLIPADGRGGSGPTQAVFSANGQFTSFSVPPGKYLITATAPGWTLRSATLGGRDVSNVPLDLDSNDAAGVVVTFFDRPAQLSGVVRNARGDAEEGASVVVIPADYRSQTDLGMVPRRLRSGRSAADGRYTMSGLLPGEYIVVAMNDTLLVDGFDPFRMIDAASRVGTHVTLTDSDKRTQDLTLAQVPIR